MLSACKKDVIREEKKDVIAAETAVQPGEDPSSTGARIISSFPLSVPAGIFTTYTIPTGQHFSDKNTRRAIVLNSMPFVARFNTSAMYATANPANQADINMLYGFAEGPDHQWNSARIGWNWLSGTLRLYAYTYRHGVVRSQFITTAAINTDINCNISFQGFTSATSYFVFTVNGVVVKLPRANFTTTTAGYQLYPYFGGTEIAPHTVTIAIKNL
jgi:hypothetical protein